MSFHSDTLFWFQAIQSLLFLLTAACLVEKQQIPILLSLVWPNQCSNSRSTALEESILTITPLMQFINIGRKFLWFLEIGTFCALFCLAYLKKKQHKRWRKSVNVSPEAFNTIDLKKMLTLVENENSIYILYLLNMRKWNYGLLECLVDWLLFNVTSSISAILKQLHK